MIRVLIVDDSAVMRAFLGGVVKSQPDMEVVSMAADPVVAIEQIRLRSPDVVTLDVEMPRMNGLDFLRKLMTVRPLPVVMVSSLTRHGAQTTMQALELGAVDFVAKPHVSELQASADEIIEKIRAASIARVRRPITAPALRGRDELVGGVREGALIAIGASTGGVDALRVILSALPRNMPPILIAQHMPAGFTETFARRLDALCEMRVKEAEDGEPALAGTAYIAPGGHHLSVRRRFSSYLLQVGHEPPVNLHRPSVDRLFRSVATAAGDRAAAVLLTGMGSDGAEAMLQLRAVGAYTMAQDEDTCVVYGMPRQAVALGAAREVVPLQQIAARLAAVLGPVRGALHSP